MIKLVLKKGREKSVLNHHPWLFSGAVHEITGSPQKGDIAAVYDSRNNFVGTGFINPGNSLVVRFLSFNEEAIDSAFWEKRIDSALKLRKHLIGDETDSYRIIHGEGDMMPGLTVDKYGDYLAVQVSTSGMEKVKDEIFKILLEKTGASGIYEKNDLLSRKHEKLPLYEAVYSGEIPEQITITENGYKFMVNVRTGQKTGFFLDQRENRNFVKKLSEGRKVLNACSYTGGFTVYAAAGGAEATVSLDISEDALRAAEANMKLNGFDSENHRYLTGDVFEKLKIFHDENFDMIILDPPAFAKSRDAIKSAARGYKEINLQALRIIAPGGILVTCSCSQHIDAGFFQKIVHDAAKDAGRYLRIIEMRSQAFDHPVSINHPEGVYLKCLTVYVE